MGMKQNIEQSFATWKRTLIIVVCIEFQIISSKGGGRCGRSKISTATKSTLPIHVSMMYPNL